MNKHERKGEGEEGDGELERILRCIICVKNINTVSAHITLLPTKFGSNLVSFFKI